jgi:hypothetical protein
LTRPHCDELLHFIVGPLLGDTRLVPLEARARFQQLFLVELRKTVADVGAGQHVDAVAQ